MTWRGDVSIVDKISATAVYLLAMYDVAGFGQYFFSQFPFLQPFIVFPLVPVIFLYKLLGDFGGFIVFLLLFLAVVRNPKVSYFIRYNTFQSILVGVIISLLQIVFSLVGPLLKNAILLNQSLYSIIFLGGLAICLYSMVQSALGKYSEIPNFSDFVYRQLP